MWQHWSIVTESWKDERAFANSSQTKCVYVWMGLQTCTAPSVNSLHTIRHEPKFVSFLHERKGNCVRRVFASGSRKINLPHTKRELFLHCLVRMCVLAFTQNVAVLSRVNRLSWNLVCRDMQNVTVLRRVNWLSWNLVCRATQNVTTKMSEPVVLKLDM